MSTGRHFTVINLFSVIFRIFKEVDYSVVQHLVVAVSEEKGAVNIFRCFSHYVLYIPDCFRRCLVVGCPVDKIEHVFIVEWLVVFLPVFLRKTLGQKAGVELSSFMV